MAFAYKGKRIGAFGFELGQSSGESGGFSIRFDADGIAQIALQVVQGLGIRQRQVDDREHGRQFRSHGDDGGDGHKATASRLPRFHTVLDGLDDVRRIREKVQVVHEENRVGVGADPADGVDRVADFLEDLLTPGQAYPPGAVPGEKPPCAFKGQDGLRTGSLVGEHAKGRESSLQVILKHGILLDMVQFGRKRRPMIIISL